MTEGVQHHPDEFDEPPVGAGSFDGVHNDIAGRSTAGAHPDTAITTTGHDGLLTGATSVAAALAVVDGQPPIVNAQTLVRYNVDRTSGFLPFGTPPGVIVVLDGQDDPDEDGAYTSNGSLGVDVGSRVELKTLGNVVAGLTVFATVTLDNDSTAYGALDGFVDAPESSGTDPSVWRVSTPDGSTIVLAPVAPPLAAYAALVGRWFTPAMNDYSVSSNTQLTLNHQIVSVDTSGGNVTLTLGPHATIPRPTFIWHRTGANTLTVVNYPGDGDAFSYTVAPGERVLVLPDGAAWHAWRLPQDAGSLVFDNAVLADADSVQGALDMIGNAAMYALRSDGAGDYLLQNPGGVATSPTSIPTGAVKVFHGPDDPAATTIWGAYVEACDQWIDPGTHHKIRNLANNAWLDM